VDRGLTIPDAAPNVQESSRHASNSRDSQSRRTATWCVLAVVSYLALASIANWEAWIHGASHTIQVGGAGDLDLDVWLLSVTPHLLLHGHNIFVTNWLNFPYGVNLMDNIGMPLLGLASAPVGLIFGPVTAFNVTEMLCFASAAIAMFFVARAWTGWLPGAYFAGLLFGFSPYMVAQGQGHLHLLFTAMLPIIFYLLARVIVIQRGSAWRWGCVLGLALVAQLLLSVEILVSALVMSACGGVVVCILGWRSIRSHVGYFAKAGGTAIGLFLVLGSYPMWIALRGPQHTIGSPWPRSFLNGFAVDPAGFVIPRANQHFELSGLAHIGDALAAVSTSEDSSYLGILLAVFLVATIVVLWRRPIVRFLGIVLVIALVLSMGNRLVIAGHVTFVRLPFKVFTYLPFFNSLVAARFMVYVFLFAALLLGIGLEWIRDRTLSTKRATPAVAGLLAGIVGIAVLVPLVPAWPYAMGDTSVPAAISSTAISSIPERTTLLTFPFPRWASTQPMLWQSLNGFNYNLPGGFLSTPDGSGHAVFIGVPSTTETLLESCQTSPSLPRLTPEQISAVHVDLKIWNVHTVLITSDTEGPAAMRCAVSVVTQALGPPTRLVGGAAMWTGVASPEIAPLPPGTKTP
jgi:hypothetical protein